MTQKPAASAAPPAGKKAYRKPQLIRYGSVDCLVRSGTRGGTESMTRPTRRPSDRGLKCDVVRVGEHRLGFGLYLFRYRPAFREAFGQGRQFGVMADEVAAVFPEAVSRSAQGHLEVDYDMLGIRPGPG